MGTIKEKEIKIARDLVLKSKKALAEKIQNETVKNVGISECAVDENYTAATRVKITGAVETLSPTKKARTHLFHATVDVSGKEAKIAALDVAPREE